MDWLYEQTHRKDAKGPYSHLQQATERIAELRNRKVEQEAKVNDILGKRKKLAQTREELEKEGIIKKTRIVGRARMYTLNKENPTAKILRELDFKLCSAKADEEIGRMKVKAKSRG